MLPDGINASLSIQPGDALRAGGRRSLKAH